MKNMKIFMIAAFTLATLATSCKKEELIQPNDPVVQMQCCSEIDSVTVNVYLLDFDTMYPSTGIQINTWHFENSLGLQPYVLTKSEGVTLDSAVLDIITYDITAIDTSFMFSNMFTQYPTIIDGLKINTQHETTMEVWYFEPLPSVNAYVKIATFYIAKTGFYNVFENEARATSTMCPTNSVGVADERFIVMTRM